MHFTFMFKAIQVLKDSKVVRLNSHGHIGSGKPKDRSTLTVMRKKGYTVELPFGGFIYTGNTDGLKLLKAKDIIALYTDDHAIDVVYKIPSGHYVVGVYVEGRVFILILDGQIRHEMWRFNAPQNNVIEINKKPKYP